MTTVGAATSFHLAVALLRTRGALWPYRCFLVSRKGLLEGPLEPQSAGCFLFFSLLPHSFGCAVKD